MTDTQQETPTLIGPLEMRAAQTVGVRWPERIIELVAVPWDSEARVEHRGRVITESFSRGAFDGVEGRPNRIKVYRDHPPLEIIPMTPPRPVGRAVALHPSRTEGLVAELGISNTVLGDETLALAEDGVLDASINFGVFPQGEQWQRGRSHRQITHAFLGHIAMVPEAAYTESRVLAVRAAHGVAAEIVKRQPTPLLDEWRLRLLRDKFEGR